MLKIPDIAPFKSKLAELDGHMQAPDFYADQRRAAEISREHQRIATIIEKHDALRDAQKRLAEGREMLADAGMDAELRELAQEEASAMEAAIPDLEQAVLRAMIPPESSDERNIVMEIRGGAGGDEANIFAGDLFRMYSRYAETLGWRIEPMSSSAAEAGGFKEIIFSIKGEGAYKTLKFESGVHRVQRVPVTEAGGRIHTSTATVAVLPEAEEVDVEINPAELEISTMRASGAGGQHVNTTDSAVQILHKPTGLIVYCADERSQLKNKTKAMTVLRSRLLKRKEDEEHAKYAANRKSQVGTGDRSERIRTYNFPQGRLTDHRIGLNLSLPTVIDGGLEDLIQALQDADTAAKIDELMSAGE